MNPEERRPPGETRSDEDLVAQLASGHQEAIGPLYSRYARRIFGMAVQALDRPAAEEVVQDVFVAIWRNASSFDAARGPVAPWLLQIAHFRIANELRTVSRRPRPGADPPDSVFARIPDPAPDPSDEAWEAYRKSALLSALSELPPPQRRALSLAFFEDLTHDQVASALGLPLGTAKSRIRAGLSSLRQKLAPIVAAVVVAGLLGWLAVRGIGERRLLGRDERALTMLTSSDSVALRLAAAPGVDPRTHATYRSRPGGSIAVLTLSNFAPAPAGRVYQGWASIGGRWISLGVATPDSLGKARLIAEGGAFSASPQALEVTLESESGGALPSPSVIVSWRP